MNNSTESECRIIGTDGKAEHGSIVKRRLSTKQLQGLLARLVSNSQSIRDGATREVHNLDVQSQLGLLVHVRNSQSHIRIFANSFLSSAIACCLLFHILHNVLFVFLLMGGTGGYFVTLRTRQQLRKAVPSLVAKFDSVEAAGELVAMLAMHDDEIVRIVRTILIKLLPTLQPKDVSLFDRQKRRVLLSFMKRQNFVRFVDKGDRQEAYLLCLCILKALEQIGDASFIPVVSNWAGDRGPNYDTRLQHAAKECLEFLKIRSVDASPRSELLRPSEAEGRQSLVRAASKTSKVAASQLLRATQSTDTLQAKDQLCPEAEAVRRVLGDGSRE